MFDNNYQYLRHQTHRAAPPESIE